MWPPALAWWVYLLIALSIFIGCLSLHLFVKKINEARIAERFHRLSQKASTSQSTQVQYPLIEIELSRAAKLAMMSNSGENIDPAVKGISLVFDKEENLLNEKNRAFEEDLMQQVEEIPAKNDDDVSAIKNCESNSDFESKNMDSESKIDAIIKPTLLGNIYKSANNSVCNKMNRENEQDSILNDLLDEIMTKVNDVKSISSDKSTTSVKKCNVPENNDIIK